MCFSLYELGRWEAMERAATTAAKLAPKDSYVWQQVAIAAGERAVHLNARNAYARFNLAMDRKKAGEPNTVPKFRKAIALDASLAEFLDDEDRRALRRRRSR